jgi:small-conductance mechanosensitive channel
MSTTIPAIEENWVIMQAATKTEEHSLLYLNQYTSPVLLETRTPSSLFLKSENTKSNLEQHMVQENMVEEKSQTRTAVQDNMVGEKTQTRTAVAKSDAAAAAVKHPPTFTKRVRRQSKKTYKKRNVNRQRRVTKQREAAFQERLQINKLKTSHFYNTQYCLMLKQQKQLRKEWEEQQLEKYDDDDDDFEDFLCEIFVILFCFLIVLFFVAIFIVQ